MEDETSEDDDAATEGYEVMSISSADAAASLLLFFLLARTLLRGSPPEERDSERSRSNVSTRYRTRPSPGSGRPAMASSSVAPHVALFFPDAMDSSSSAPPPSQGDESLALTFFSSEKSHSGARGGSYSAIAIAIAGAAETLPLPLGVLGAGLLEAGVEQEHFFLPFLTTATALPPTAKAVACFPAASPATFFDRRMHDEDEDISSETSRTFSADAGSSIRFLAAESDATAANGRLTLGLLAAGVGVGVGVAILIPIPPLRSQQKINKQTAAKLKPLDRIPNNDRPGARPTPRGGAAVTDGEAIEQRNVRGFDSKSPGTKTKRSRSL